MANIIRPAAGELPFGVQKLRVGGTIVLTMAAVFAGLWLLLCGIDSLDPDKVDLEELDLAERSLRERGSD